MTICHTSFFSAELTCSVTVISEWSWTQHPSRQLFHRNQIRKMESKFMKPGEDVIIDHGLKNKWCWAWIEERGVDGKPFGSWYQKLREPGTCFCVLRSKKLVYAIRGKKVEWPGYRPPTSMGDRKHLTFTAFIFVFPCHYFILKTSTLKISTRIKKINTKFIHEIL